MNQKKEVQKNKSLLEFKETKELILANYVKNTKEIRKKISENKTFAPLTSF